MEVYEIEGYLFREMTSLPNVLIISTDYGNIRVRFDANCKPFLEYKDGPIRYVGLPEDVETKLKEKLCKLYPNGFVSRRISTCSTETWLEALKLNELERNLELVGKMKIYNVTAKKYKAYCTVDGKEEEIIIWAQQCKNRVIIFKKFATEKELPNFPDDAALVYSEKAIQIVNYDEEKKIFYFDGFAMAKEYKFELDMSIKSVKTAIRNDHDGFFLVGDMGKFLPMTCKQKF